jgi:hypothetical protein
MRAAWTAAVVLVLGLLCGCAQPVPGTATWPGATLEKVVLTEQDFPAGVRYDRILEDPADAADSGGIGGPPSMLSEPEGCANALTNVIARTAERGPGAAAKYAVGYDGARIVMTVLSSPLDLGRLHQEAQRCEHFEVFFDRRGPGIPVTTEVLSSGSEALAYRQTMRLGGESDSVYMSFANIAAKSVFAVAFPVPDPSIEVKATLPQTFTDIFDRQVARVRS